MRKNKGFAVTGMLYAILVLFLLLVSAVLALLANRKLILDKVKNEVSATLLGEVSYIGFDSEYLAIANNTNHSYFTFDVLDGVIVYDEHGSIVDTPVEVSYSNLDQSVNGSYLVEYRATVDGREVSGSRTIEVIDPVVYNYSYILDTEQVFSPEVSGTYLLEVWGAQGGDATGVNSNIRAGGYGGYAKGVAQFRKNEQINIVVGGEGVDGSGTTTQDGGYNGGGDGLYHGGSGGGATHVATSTGLLSDLSDSRNNVLIVAGGGGGAAVTNDENCSDGGHAGGYIGNDANLNACTDTVSSNGYGTGGTQETGGSSSINSTANLGLFGTGAISSLTDTSYGAGGGGGGFFGGGASSIAGAGGGSGYIASSRLISYGALQKSMYCYSCQPSSVASTFTNSTDYASEDPITNAAKIGNGAARITALVIKEPIIS